MPTKQNAEQTASVRMCAQ